MSNLVSAIAVFNTKKIKGIVRFTETREGVLIDIDLSGLGKNKLHGFHIHQYGDVSDECNSMCSHFNPFNKNHGGPDSKERHVGDLGNLKTDATGCVKHKMVDNMIKLRGSKSNIIGRGLIIHADEDDLGLGGFPDSLTTGHAGARIACSVIGYAKPIGECK
jgi:Cu-Zn family superoxide dismutase